jgi:hypothetical protein
MHSSSCSIFALPFSLSDGEEDDGSEELIERDSMDGTRTLGETSSLSMLTHCDDLRNEMIDAAEKEDTTLPL